MTFEEFKTTIQNHGFPADSGYYNKFIRFYVFTIHPEKMEDFELFRIFFEKNEWRVSSKKHGQDKKETREQELHKALEGHYCTLFGLN
jgi:hypothetical protein